MRTERKKYALNLKGIPNAAVTSKDGAKATLDAEGNGSITVNFDNAYNIQNAPLALTVSADGYMEGTTSIEVKNLKYDAKRVADDAEKERKRVAAEAEKQRIQGIIDQMDTYAGGGDVMIAVGKEVRKTRCLSYSCGQNGGTFIAFSLVVKNVGEDVAYVNPNDVTLKDSSGRMYTYEAETYSLGRPFDGVSLQPNSYTSGALAFLVPEDEHEYTVIYSGYGGGAVKQIYVK